MKLIAIILLLPTVCLSQNKNDNTIILPVNISAQTIKTILFQNGYSITGNDTAFINTTSKAVPKTSVSVKFMLLKTDTATIVKGMFKSLVSLSFGSAKIEDDYRQIQYRGMKGGDYMQAWNELDRIAKVLSLKAYYSRQ